MLDLSGFQIFYMVLHGAIVVFVLVFLARGNEKKQKVVNYNDYRHNNRSRKDRQTTPQTVNQSQSQYRDVYEAVVGQDFYLNTAPSHKPLTVPKLIASSNTVDVYEDTVTERVTDLFDD